MSAIPKSSTELEEALNDKKYLEMAPEELKAFIRDYAIANMPSYTKSLVEESQKGMLDFLKEHGFLPAPQPRTDVRRLPMVDGHPRGDQDAPGAVLNGEFKRMADFYKAVDWQTVQRQGIDPRFTKVLGEGQGDQGGFLVPEEFRAQLLSLALEQAIVRPRAQVIPMTTPTIRIPAIRDTTHASSVFGGIIAYWTPESGTITQTEPTFAQARLDAMKLVGGTRVANELIRDSAISIEGLLNALFPAAIAFFEDDAFINGVGGGQPVGILNADALISVAKETGQAATTIVWENIVKMYSRMLPASLGRAVWVAHNDTFPQLALMSLSVGTGGSAIWLNNGVAGPPATILGRPVFFTEKAQTLGTAGDIYFADFLYYLIGDRQALEVASSQHVRFNTDETDWRFIERVAGRPWIDSALTPKNGSNTVSPFVNLATRA